MPDQLQELYDRWRVKPNKASTTELMTGLSPTIDQAIKAQGLPVNSSMRTAAHVHLLSVLPNYDSSKAKFNTFATNELRRLKRISEQRKTAIPVPEQAAIDLQNVRKHEDNLRYELGRDPTDDELSDASGLSMKRIRTITSKYGAPVVSEGAFETEEGDMSVPGTHAMSPNELWTDAVYSELDPIDKKIFEWSTGRNGKTILSKAEMAAKLKLSAPAITQRASRIAMRLEDGLQQKVL